MGVVKRTLALTIMALVLGVSPVFAQRVNLTAEEISPLAVVMAKECYNFPNATEMMGGKTDKSKQLLLKILALMPNEVINNQVLSDEYVLLASFFSSFCFEVRKNSSLKK